MKKHIFGLAIFSFIVGAAAIVHAAFNVRETNRVADVVPGIVFAQNNSPDIPTSCWNMKRESKGENPDQPFIKQAVYNVKTKMLKWRLADSEIDSLTTLHFFVGDEKGIRHIFSSTARSSATDGKLNFSPGDATLDKISERRANLFLIADVEAVSPFSDSVSKSREAKFDASKAVSVTIDYGN